MNKWSSKLAAVTVGTTVLLTSVGQASAATYTVKSGDSLDKIGKANNISYKTIMNTNKLTSTLIFPGQQLIIGENQTTTTSPPSSMTTYTVKSGDSLSKIGSQYGVSTKTIMEWNNLSSTLIQIGQKLVVNGSTTSITNSTSNPSDSTNTTTYTVKSGDSLSKIGSQYGVASKTLIEWNNLSSTLIHIGQKLVVKSSTTSTTNLTTNSSNSSNTSTYTVKSGDSLSKIGSQFGISSKTIMEVNNLSSTAISVGQKLIISGATTSSSSTSTSSSVGNNIVSVAKQYLGAKYVFDGASPNGFDCSGFITYVYNKAGISTSRLSAAGFYNASTPISKPKIGDLVFFSNTYKSGISHIGIYIGDNKMIAASGYFVQISDIDGAYWENHFTGFGRLS
ncbi:LysM peptidoglycan-binding domain-containing protein [Psychrobacillus glaciei]|uniref:LysM peptidoglycan-binding domain-containing protein n=1 Tax=Psychrobacillus glaciei TaxID=2283160 RepID=A0A5J6SLS9_9BACI|nr:LysM peptidoglycan-binding domain-containing protein [Psychrobacillus glaciei]QFF98463.1 LysM peptidoglycan-binding domain-containing protein [Psychrobacillus glaciei]